jgi:hypothetical protein
MLLSSDLTSRRTCPLTLPVKEAYLKKVRIGGSCNGGVGRRLLVRVAPCRALDVGPAVGRTLRNGVARIARSVIRQEMHTACGDVVIASAVDRD